MQPQIGRNSSMVLTINGTEYTAYYYECAGEELGEQSYQLTKVTSGFKELDYDSKDYQALEYHICKAITEAETGLKVMDEAP
jgi:hypothetical protein